MPAHQGDIIERIIRRQGHSISDLAKLTGVNRRSIYNWFLQPKLKPENIIKLGQAIGHDFSEQFPNQFVSEDFIPAEHNTILTEEKIDIWKEKYIDLLERYNLLLRIAKGEVPIPKIVERAEASMKNNKIILV